MDKLKNVFVQVGEGIGLIIGGLIFLFVILIGGAWLLTGPLGLSPNSSATSYGLGAAALIGLFPFWLMFKRRAEQRPEELLRLNQYSFAYFVWSSISGMAAMIGVAVFAILNHAVSYQLISELIGGFIFFLLFFLWYKHRLDINQQKLKASSR